MYIAASQIYFPIYVITTANIANSLDRTGCNDNCSNISRRICVWRRRRSEGRREENYPERREEKRDLWRRDIRVEERVSIGACFAAVYFFGSRSLPRLLRGSERIYERERATQSIRSPRDTPLRLPVNTRAPVIRGSCVLINPGCARARKRSQNYTIAPVH